MPFDTTYHFTSDKDNGFWKIISHGGKDTTINVKEGDSNYNKLNPRFIDSLIKSISHQPQNKVYTEEKTNYEPIVFLAVMAAIFALRYIKQKKNDEYSASSSSSKIEKSAYLTYHGESLNFSDAEITTVLEKHFPYFCRLSPLQKTKFIDRTQLFIADKIFKIHTNPGFKEMPILISAAAVQLTFGLQKFLLPNFTFIHVYPQEFLGVHPTLRVLEGNVSGHTINLSWKHFLDGYKKTTNGQNTGLHELAHALYYQTFVVEQNVDRNFRDTFDNFNEDGNKAFKQESSLAGNKLYSDYGLRSFQEFWAESIEIFFEKPWQLRETYPQLYRTLVELLNQDPCITTPLPKS